MPEIRCPARRVLQPILYEAVAEADERPLQRLHRLVMGGLQRDQDEVELVVGRRRRRLDPHGALLAELIELQAVVEPRDVLLARVEHDDTAHRARQLGGGDAADRAAADHEHGRVDHSASSLVSAA
jgi:hypothetical protein